MSNSVPARSDPFGATRVVLRPVATPLPLGFLALAIASFVFAGLELSWIDPAANGRTVGLIALVVPVPLQLISAVLGYLGRDAVAGTGTGILAGTWLAVGAVTWTGAPGSTSQALGLLLLASAAALLVPLVAGLSGKILASGVLAAAATRFAVTGIYELTGSTGWQTAAGTVGLVVSAVAFCGALAFEVEGTHLRTVLPTGRRGRGSTAMTGSLADQVAQVAHEAGVRQQL